MDLLISLPKTKWVNQHVLLMTNLYSKLTRDIQMARKTSSLVETAFIDHWVIPYGIHKYVFSDNGTQFVAKFFESSCGYLVVSYNTTTSYPLQANVKPWRNNNTIVARLHHSVKDTQSDWDDYVHPLTYDYKLQIHRSTIVTPFGLVLYRHPLYPETTDSPTAL